MAVERMNLVSIAGPVSDFERVVLNYISDKEIHVENLFDVVGNTSGLKHFDQTNEYSEPLRKAHHAMTLLKISDTEIQPGNCNMQVTEAEEYFEKLADMIEGMITDTDKLKADEFEKISLAYRSIKRRYDAVDAKKYAGRSKNIFVIAGWVPEDYTDEYLKLFKSEKNIAVNIENTDEVPEEVTPPTKLKNFILFRPFQSFIEMYGLPSYNEIDPTAIFAITYMLMFGIMYGDVGHGFVLGIAGFVMAKKKNFLGPILMCCGVVSMIFGAVFSSVFGYEGVLWHPLWEPMHNMMPTLLATVAMGIVIITIVMIMNIINGIKQKNLEKVLLDPNGLAGIIFYWGAIIIVLGVLNILPVKISGAIAAVLIAVPLLLMFLKEPLGKLIEGRKDWLPEDKGGYVLETFFELFELILSYITNTVSFIRVGAFALNHAGMMSVVFMLSRLSGGSDNIAVIIIGNLLVLALEGLLVAIQVLRLQFYEMFGRYYDGSGRPFTKIDNR